MPFVNQTQPSRPHHSTRFFLAKDGPNVAYYMQNFDKGKFNFHQIEFVVTALEKIGERPLGR